MTWRERLSTLKIYATALAAILLGIFLYGWRRYSQGRRTGEAEGRGKEREKGVRKAGENGDMEALDDYWRGKR